MPIYEFRCTQCGNIQEVIVSSSVSEEHEMKCNACQGEVLERVLSRVSYVMGDSSSGAGAASASLTSKSCAPGNSCSTLTLPGYNR
jgi:putative FmdB family regulatory protein